MARWMRSQLQTRWTSSALQLRHASAFATTSCKSDSDGATALPLRIGVLGLGAIGTIFFTKLGAAAIASAHARTATLAPQLAVDALVKPQHLQTLFADSAQPHVALHDHMPAAAADAHNDSADAPPSAKQIADRIAFHQQTPALAVATLSDRVRIRALADRHSDDRTDVAHTQHADQLDIVLVAVKAYDSEAVVQTLQTQHAHLLKDDALVVLLQNGLSDVAATHSSCAAAKRWRFAHGVTYVGGRTLSLGHVAVSGVAAAATYVAPVAATAADDNEQLVVERIDALCGALSVAGLQCEQLSAAAMQAMQWKKLIVNAGINPIAAILNAPNESVGACEWSRACVDAVVREAFDVARHEHVALEGSAEELVHDVLQVAANTGANVCSMVADLRRGSCTEIDAITGQIVALGRAHGVATPANMLLLRLVHALELQRTHAAMTQE